MSSPTKVYAFIDSQNINLGVKSLGWNLDFKRFRIYLKDKYKVEKAFLFLGYIKENDKLLRVIVPNNQYSSLLKEFSKYIVNIEPLRRILRKK